MSSKDSHAHGASIPFSLDTIKLEADTKAIGLEILARMKALKTPISLKGWWTSQLLRWASSNESRKTQLFRYIDVLPTLKTHKQIVAYLRDYLIASGDASPAFVRWSLNTALRNPLTTGMTAKAIQLNAHWMARRFILSENFSEAAKELGRLWGNHTAFTISLLGEDVVSELEAEGYQRRYLEILSRSCDAAARWPPQPLLERDDGGPLPRVSLSLKLSSLYSQMDPIDPDRSSAVLSQRLLPILRGAKELGASITLDMEQYQYKDLTFQVFCKTLEGPEFKDWPDAGIVVQAYLYEAEDDLLNLLKWAKRRPSPITVRLVRGAYWEYETVTADLQHWPSPVFNAKWQTDETYERLTNIMLQNYPHIRLALGTHNVRSIACASAISQQLGLSRSAFEVQTLYGMGDTLKSALLAMGMRLRTYLPFGPLIPGMAYLVRRLLESSSNESFLRLYSRHSHSQNKLLQSPSDVKKPQEKGPERRTDVASPKRSSTDAHLTPYSPEPLTDFSRAESREKMHQALKEVRGYFGRYYPLLIDGREVVTSASSVSKNPARPSEIIGQVAKAGQQEAELAVKGAGQAFHIWRDTPPAKRASYLFKAASVMRRRRFELAAWEVFETAKPWREADADIAEAIDFLEYYGREMIRLGTPLRLGDEPGEVNEYFYQPRGITVVISPWNFPLAILTGMSTAALVTGNTVIIKPSSLSSVVAAKMMEVLRETGLPDGVLNYVPGPGEEVGEYLVTHPHVSTIAFTGSKQVGTRIYALAAQLQSGQMHMKRVIAEMGGKNAIIVDDDADLDEAVSGVVASAFGYQGQKCSACSRVIVLDGAYDLFLERLIEASRSLIIGPPEEPGVSVGPLIEQNAYDRVRRYIEIGRKDSKVALESDVSHLGDGYFVAPTIFSDVQPSSTIAQEEIFGPILAVMRAKDLSHALDIANNVEYALTGGIYSRNPTHISQAKQEFRVGNLYINRKITGAIVGRQPFGGFRMSGIGSKAGGPDYLLQFMEPRTVTENTLRRGFAQETPEQKEK